MFFVVTETDKSAENKIKTAKSFIVLMYFLVFKILLGRLDENKKS